MTAPGPDAELDELARVSLGVSTPPGHEPGSLDVVEVPRAPVDPAAAASVDEADPEEGHPT